MTKALRTASLAGLLLTAPSLAAAQHDMASMSHGAKHEVGVDITAFYQRLSLAGVSSNQILIATPVDVRLGFVSGEKLVIEPRLAFAYHSKGGPTGDAAYVFTPDVNVLWGFQSNKKGPYVTFGAGVDLEKFGTSTSQFGFNGGLGTRVPYESGAIRLEAFGQYVLKNTGKGLPNQLNIGVRAGLSLWH